MGVTIADAAARLAATAWVLEELITGVDDEQARWKPTPERWSILEVVNHLYDEERDDFRFRFQHLLERPDEPVPPIDPPRWAVERHYNERELGASLESFLNERRFSLAWLETLDVGEPAGSQPAGAGLDAVGLDAAGQDASAAAAAGHTGFGEVATVAGKAEAAGAGAGGSGDAGSGHGGVDLDAVSPSGRRAGDLLASWVAHDLLHVKQIAKLHYDYWSKIAQPYTVDYAGEWR
ncbi:MAG: DinB family protein [Deinococcales bacterium]|jgi:hypothetical protein